MTDAGVTDEHDPPVPAAVVAGVDGSAAGLSAARWAAAEAQRTGTGLRLVHVAPDYAPTTPMLPLIRDDFERTGQRILAEAHAEVARVAPETPVATLMRTGPTVRTLLSAVQDAPLVVLGREHHGRVASLVTGSTSAGVAARAACPVVSVPDGADAREPRGRVAVGLKSAAQAAALLGPAFAEAEGRGARLVVLHAWKLPGAYDDIVRVRTHTRDRAAEVEAEVDPVLDELRRRHPGVEVELTVVHEQPAAALLRVAAVSDLVLVLRRGPRRAGVGHLGGTVRTLLREADAPVEVVPWSGERHEAEGRSVEGLTDELGEELTRRVAGAGPP